MNEYLVIEAADGGRTDLEDLLNKAAADRYAVVQVIGKNRVIMSRVKRDEAWYDSRIKSAVEAVQGDLDGGFTIRRAAWVLDDEEQPELVNDAALEFIIRRAIVGLL